MAIPYTFNKALFNPLFFQLRAANTRWVVSWGGAGSSKSYTQAQHEVVKSLERKEKILVLRKVSETLRDSVIPLIVHTIIPNWGGLQKDFHFNKSERVLTNKVNGSQFIFRGMDDPEKIKSIQGITRVWVEEATEFDEADIDQLNIRLRGAKNLQITLTFNPIDELHWLKKKFFDKDFPNCTFCHTTYLDNRYIDDAFVVEIERYKVTDPNFYAVYGLGQWGRLTKGGEFYKNFKPDQHVSPVAIRDAVLPLHITFDENVNPYTTLNVWQGEAKRVWQIDEIMLEDPRNTLSETLKEFFERYPPNGTRVFIYGDATSNKADAKLEKGVNWYSIIEKFLQEKKYIHERRVPGSNPSVELRGTFINQIWGDGFDDIEISIGANCKKTTADYMYLKQASDGSKFKEVGRNPTTKVTFQKWGHATDANDYFICKYFEESYELFKTPDVDGSRWTLQRRNLKKRY